MDEQIRLAVPDVTHMARSKSILRQGNFNIESTRVTPQPDETSPRISDEGSPRKSDDSGCPDDKGSGSNRSSLGSSSGSSGCCSLPETANSVAHAKSGPGSKGAKDSQPEINKNKNVQKCNNAKLQAAAKDNANKAKTHITHFTVTPSGENGNKSVRSERAQVIHVQEYAEVDTVSDNKTVSKKDRVIIHSDAFKEGSDSENKSETCRKAARPAVRQPVHQAHVSHANRTNLVKATAKNVAGNTATKATPGGKGPTHNTNNNTGISRTPRRQSPNRQATRQISPNSRGSRQVSPNSRGSRQISPNSRGSRHVSPNSRVSRQTSPSNSTTPGKRNPSQPGAHSESPGQPRTTATVTATKGMFTPAVSSTPARSRQPSQSPSRPPGSSYHNTTDKAKPAVPPRPVSQIQRGKSSAQARPGGWNNNFTKTIGSTAKPLPAVVTKPGSATPKVDTNLYREGTQKPGSAGSSSSGEKTPPARPPPPQFSSQNTNIAKGNLDNNSVNKRTEQEQAHLQKTVFKKDMIVDSKQDTSIAYKVGSIVNKHAKMPEITGAREETNIKIVIGTPPKIVKSEDVGLSTASKAGSNVNAWSKTGATEGTGSHTEKAAVNTNSPSSQTTRVTPASAAVRMMTPHTGPVFSDPFESIRDQLNKREEEVNKDKAERLKSARYLGVSANRKSGKADSRQGSGGKKPNKKGVDKKTPPDAYRTVRPKSGKKGRGKKKKRSAEKTKVIALTDKSDLSKVAFIGGVGWHIETDCNENSKVKAAKFRPPVADWSDEEDIMSARVMPNYIDSPRSEISTDSARRHDKIQQKAVLNGACLLQLPGAISPGESADEYTEEEDNSDEEIDDAEAVEDEVVFNHDNTWKAEGSGSNRSTPRLPKLTVTPGKSITISPRAGGRSPRGSPRKSPRSYKRGSTRVIKSPSSPNNRSPSGQGSPPRAVSPKSQNVKSPKTGTTGGMERLWAAEMDVRSKSPTPGDMQDIAPETTEVIDKFVHAASHDYLLHALDTESEDVSTEASSGESATNLHTQSKQHHKAGQNNHKGVTNSTKTTSKHETLNKLSKSNSSSAESINEKNKRKGQSKPQQKLVISESDEDEELEAAIDEILKTTPHPSMTLSLKSQGSIKESSGGKPRSGRSPEEARSQFEQQLQNTLNGKTFRQIPVEQNEPNLRDLHKDFDLSDDDKSELERLMDSLKQMELMVSLPIDADSDQEDTEEEMTPRQDSVKSSAKSQQKPPIAPKSSNSPKMTDRSTKTPPKASKGVKPARPGKLTMPEGSRKSEKSPRFVMKKDSWKEIRPTLPPDGDDLEKLYGRVSNILFFDCNSLVLKCLICPKYTFGRCHVRMIIKIYLMMHKLSLGFY